MKKLLALLTLIIISGTAFAATGLDKVANSINKGVNTLNQKEQSLNRKIDKAQADSAAKRVEAQKKSEANKAAAIAKVDAQKKVINDTKKAVQEEKNAWKNILNK